MPPPIHADADTISETVKTRGKLIVGIQTGNKPWGYIERHRKVSLDPASDPGTFFINTVELSSSDTSYNQTTFTVVSFRRTKQILNQVWEAV